MKRSPTTILSAVVAATTSLAACGGGGGLSLTEALDRSARMACEKFHECRSTWPYEQFIPFADLFGNSVSECIANFSENREALIASVDAGRISYDEDAAEACIDATRTYYSNTSCDVFWEDETEAPASCEMTLQGQVADGSACTIDEDCAGADSYCDEETMLCTAEPQ